jgi:uncharacterized protein
MNSSQPIPTAPGVKSLSQAVAPVWHTVVVLAALLGLSLFGALSKNIPEISSHGRAAGYVFIMAFEWVIVAFIWYGLRGRGITMAEVVGGRWQRPVEALRDLGIAVGFLVLCGFGLLSALGYLLKPAPNEAIKSLFPHTPTEIALYLLLTLTAGFCEEVIFRGYLQRQFAALTKSFAAATVLQGIAFGASHGYQGWKFIVIISIYGITFGLLASWRSSLRPGMIAHFLQDAVSGILGPHLR